MTYHIAYDSDGTPSIIRDSDNATIPPTESNADFRAFREWNAAQPVPLDYTTPGPKARRPRTIAAIRSDLQALTAQQRQAIWNDIQFRLVARWCQEHPEYLVAPAFAPEIDLPGDAPG